ncbi:unnamed protein product [Ilex paraguariensis]|uniref:Uncharacterized protein n=1 Tax=Ilex paraguariensis TaxID=185542 RepID=A0ABC8SLX6_9AQUA
MDREQEEMQFLGLFGIYTEAFKIIFRWRRIFSQITLSLVLPLSFIFLAHIEVAHLILSKIFHLEFMLHRSPPDSRRFKRVSDVISSEWVYFWIFKFVYFTFLLVFSLLSTSAVVYTVASVYTAREVTFKKVMSVVPKVWKRLMVTFLCTFVALFAYNFVAGLILYFILDLIDSNAGVIIFYIILVCYIVGFIYVTIIWQLASVVSVLEESYGFKAMIKSKELIKGKMWIAIVIFFKLNFSFFAIQYVFEYFVVRRWTLERFEYRFGVGLLCFFLLLKLILFGLVIQTIIYFVCKSYHHENIDKSTLSDHLEVYLGEYEPLKAKDIQLEQYEV